MSPVVSVLLPSFNHARYLPAAIDSVLGQSLEALELIVVDDASSDDSWSIIEAQQDPRVRSVRHGANQGAHQTLNEALSMARGEFVAILNSDDVYAAQRLETLVDTMRATQAGLGFSDLHFIDDAGEPCDEHERAREHAGNRDWCAARPASDWFLCGNLAVTTSNFVFRRTLADEIGGFLPLRYTHDWAFALEAAARAPLCRLAQPLLSYRVHPSNTLSEADRWRHVHENAFIQSLATRRLQAIMQRQGDERDIDALLCALLRNRSGPPAVTLAAVLKLAHGMPEAELLALARGADGWWAERLAECAGLAAEVFGSAGQIGAMAHCIDNQARMLRDRWDAMEAMRRKIDERNSAIIAQKDLIEQRWLWIKALESDLAHRDEIIKERDRSIAAQAQMLEERYASMQEMGRHIFERDQTIQALEGRLDRILRNPLVRVALKTRDALRGRS